MKRVSWNEKSDEDLEIQTVCNLDVYQVGSLTSDSDLSDGEGGKVVNLAKEQAKTRHATFNLIIRLANVSLSKKAKSSTQSLKFMFMKMLCAIVKINF